jgi:CHASE3 domain sensor protein
LTESPEINKECTLEQHDKKTVDILHQICNLQQEEMRANSNIIQHLDAAAKIHIQSAQNLLQATESIKIMTEMAEERDTWFQKMIDDNAAFWRKVVWRVIILGGVLILATFGLEKFIGAI